MHRRSFIVTAAAAAITLGGGGAVALAATNQGEPPVPIISNAQPPNGSSFACYNEGPLSYYEFRLPLPHTCWFARVTLVELPAKTITFNTAKVTATTVGPTPALKGCCTLSAPH